MPEKKTVERARRDKRQGKAPSTQAGEFVREEFHHIRSGKHGASSTKQAIAIGLSKARRAGVDLPPSKTSSSETRRNAQLARAAGKKRTKPSATRSRATREALLDVFVVRKLGLPGHEELAMGAVASGGIQVLNNDVVHALAIAPQVIDQVAVREREELVRRERLYRGDRTRPDVRDKTVIVIDDGLATGSTMKAAVRALRVQRPA